MKTDDFINSISYDLSNVKPKKSFTRFEFGTHVAEIISVTHKDIEKIGASLEATFLIRRSDTQKTCSGYDHDPVYHLFQLRAESKWTRERHERDLMDFNIAVNDLDPQATDFSTENLAAIKALIRPESEAKNGIWQAGRGVLIEVSVTRSKKLNANGVPYSNIKFGGIDQTLEEIATRRDLINKHFAGAK
jgi:hypothetical protein